jgi:hypothetical protein
MIYNIKNFKLYKEFFYKFLNKLLYIIDLFYTVEAFVKSSL